MNNFEDAITFPCGISMKNRFMLAPLTNSQSHDDGTLSDEEFHWLTMRAKGSFGLTMTCAAHVQANGRGFPGQLGIFDDEHIEGHRKLAEAINNENQARKLLIRKINPITTKKRFTQKHLKNETRLK